MTTAGESQRLADAQQAAEVRWAYRPVSTYVYKETPQGRLEIQVHYPFDWREGDRRPGILFFFGGGFTHGTPEQFTRQATYLAGRGMVAARADYRVKLRHGATIDQCFEDGISAVRWFRGHAAMLGLDPARVVVSGGSAGGTLAAAAGALKDLDAPDEDRTVSARPDALVLYNPAIVPPEGRRAALGLSDEMIRRLALRPRADAPPAAVFFGTEDRLLAAARPYLEALAKLGCRVDLWLARGAGHGFFNDPPWFERALYRTDRFLASLGLLESRPTFPAPGAPRLVRAG